MSSCYVTISSCGEYKISTLCIPQIYQGDDGVIDLTLLDKTGQPLDLNDVNSIQMMVYGVNPDYYLEYMYPSVTPFEDITIVQSGEGTSLLDKGKISFFIPSTFTENLVSGDIYAGIRIITIDTSLPGGRDIITFNCIKIADAKYSKLNFRNRFMENYDI